MALRLMQLLLLLLTGQGTEFCAAAHEFVESDSAVDAVAVHDDAHGLRAQIKTCTATRERTETSTLIYTHTFIHTEV